MRVEICESMHTGRYIIRYYFGPDEDAYLQDDCPATWQLRNWTWASTDPDFEPWWVGL